MNQVLTKTYSTGGTNAAATATVTYTYSDPAVPYSIGRLTKIDNGIQAQITAYDPLGRPASTSQTVGGTTYGFPVYSYNRADGLTSVEYPSGRQVDYTFDGAGRVSALTRHGAGSYATAVQYHPSGAVQMLSLALPNSATLNESTVFDPLRMQPTSITAQSGATTLWTAALGYGAAASNNGNLLSQTLTLDSSVTTGPLSFSQTYSYDGLNRLKTAQEANAGANTGWNQWYVMDGVGNRAELAGTYNGTAYYVPGGSWTPQVADPTPALLSPQFPNNRWSGAQYDNGSPNQAGNMTGLAGSSFVYDGEDRMVSSASTGGTTAYVYDGDGRRVQKTTGGATTTFVYDAGGNMAAEYVNGAPPAAPCGTCYLVADHLGSTRAVVDATSGKIVELHDYLPFGEEIPAGMNGRAALWGSGFPNQKFTGKERDSETGLDYFGARYFSGPQGRFTSPDPSMDGNRIVGNPQRWDRYNYVINNPLLRIDPDGAADVTVYFMRDTFTDRSTTGRMYMFGDNGKSMQGYFLEPPAGGSDLTPKGSIPSGDYSGAFQEQLNSAPVLSLFIFKGVPGRSNIMAHNGNAPANTRGCFLYGKILGKCDLVGDSNLFRNDALDFLRGVSTDLKKPIKQLTIELIVMQGQWDTSPTPQREEVTSTITFQQTPPDQPAPPPPPPPPCPSGQPGCSGS